MNNSPKHPPDSKMTAEGKTDIVLSCVLAVAPPSCAVFFFLLGLHPRIDYVLDIKGPAQGDTPIY